jgi:Ni/Fe-hydrogenase subunit HybB-like protein
MWQNPLLPPHLLVQALLLGSALLLPVMLWFEPDMRFRNEVFPLLWIFGVCGLLHVLMVWGEVSLTHPTAHARLAVWEMTHGRYRDYFWIGIVLSAIGGLAPWPALIASTMGAVSPGLIIIGIGAAPLALVGLLLHEHAYVQSGQSVPLA